MKLLLLFLSILITLSAASKPLNKISLQLMWVDQFQFAGYYMAKEKGFYRDVGLDVEIKKFNNGVNVPDEVLSGRANFGVGRSSLVKHYSEGEKVVLLSAVLQSSPSVLISLKSSKINSIKDFSGKKIMLTQDVAETASIHAMIKLHDISINSLILKKQTFNLDDLISGKIDLYSGYVSNEPFLLSQRGISYNLFSPKKDGFDFYSDILFTSQAELEKDPRRVQDFRNASLLGWEYAFSHIDETVDFIYVNYNIQKKTKDALKFEAESLKKLAYTSDSVFGEIDKNKIQRIHDIYRLMGLLKSKLHLNGLIYDQYISMFTKEEKDYLDEKKEIKICVQPNMLPYSSIENEKFIGIGSSIMDKAKEIIKTPFKLVKTKTWEESLTNAKERKCDLLPVAEEIPSRRAYLKFTTPYYEEPLAIVTKSTKDYILDFDRVIDKEFAIVKDNSFAEKLIQKYPNIKLRYVSSLDEGLKDVEENKYYGYIDMLMSCSYALKFKSKNTLMITGQFYDKVKLSFAVRSDDKILFDIFQKTVEHIPHSTIENFISEWVSVSYTERIDYKYFKEILFVLFIFVLAFLYRQRLLSNKNKELEELQDELVVLNSSLESSIKEAVADLEKSQEMAKMGSWILDIINKDLRWSKQTYKIFEINAEKVEELYEEFIERVHPEDRELLKDTYYKSLEEKKDYRLEHRLLMNDGSIKYVLENSETLFSQEGIPLISYGTVQDITEAKLIEKEIEKKDAYMFHQSRLAQMGEMLSMIAHQWRQPLNSISVAQISITVALELEKYNLSDEKQREEFLNFLREKIESVGQYVQNLSETISDFSDFYKPNKASDIRTVDRSILKSYAIIKESIESNLIDVDLDLNSYHKIKILESEFMQVIINILANAKEQFAENNVNHPHITIKSFDMDDETYIEISDNAGGIDKKIIEKIFDPYFSTKLEQNGTGLGLYMSKMIIKDYHNGDIYAKNSDGGAIFTIKLEKHKEILEK